MLKSAIPVLHVTNSLAAEDFYCNRLGFRRLFIYRPDNANTDPCYMGLRRDGAEIHVSSFSGDGVAGSVVRLEVDDVNSLHSELTAQGVSIDSGPVDQTWGTREMYVKDADRNSIRYTQNLSQ